MHRPLLDPLLSQFVDLDGSDLYLTVGCAPQVRIADRMVTLGEKPLDDNDVNRMVEELLDDEKRREFTSMMECNLSVAWRDITRFRINIFRQQQHSGIVVRRIQTRIPTPDSLGLPKIYNNIIMEQRGLVLVVGPTGAGKSTSLAAMIGHRNQQGYGHIVTIEDPVEFIHSHQGCIITQRDIGIDTYSFGTALKNVLRQRPDVVVIGEIRERETMEYALHFAETGHLCVATLHASSTGQAFERVFNFFPEDKHTQVRHTLAYNLRAILSQRLVLTRQGTRTLAVEVMLNRGLIRDLIRENRVREIPEIMTRNSGEGMQTLDRALHELYCNNQITEEVALAESDNPANLRLLIRQHSFRSSPVPEKEILSLKPGRHTF